MKYAILFLIAILAGCSTDNTSRAIDRAESLLDAGKIDSALTMLDNIYEPQKLNAPQQAQYALASATCHLYKGLALENIVSILKNGHESFVSLNILEQADVLFNLIKRVSAGSNTADLKIIGGSTNTGKIRINKNITNSNLTLIIRSATGLFEKRIKL